MSGTSNNSSTSSGSSTSTSGSFIPSFPEEGFLLQLAQQAQQLEQQQYGWAQQQFANNSQLTDQVVNNYLSGASTAYNQGQHDLTRYDTLFQPEEDQLLKDANSYASDSRQKEEMGRAEATAGQAADANRAGAMRDLQSYGIDPSAGRFAGLDRAEAAQRAASQAGAANAARANTEATGRALRSEAIQVGQRYPGQAINDLNSAYQGFAGAENARLSNAAEGSQMLTAPVAYGNQAAGLRYPPLGNNSRSNSDQQSQSRGSSSQMDPSKADPSKSGSSRAGSPAGPGGSPGGSPGGATGDWNPSAYNSTPGGGGGDWSSYSDGSGGGAYDGSVGGDAFGGAGADLFGSGQGVDTSTWDFMNPGDTAVGTGDTTTTGGWGDSIGGDAGSFGGGDYFQPSGGFDDSGSSEGFAEGGDVEPTTGGAISPSLSPSQGQQTDDVPARLNAGEFVMPRDATEWYGQKFFHDLINKSRKLREQVTAKPQMKPALPQQPAFTSQRMG